MDVEDINIIMLAFGSFLFSVDQLFRKGPKTYMGIKYDCFPNVKLP